MMKDERTDKRPDDLAARAGRFEADVKERFDKVDRRFERLEDNVDARFDKVDARFEKVDARFEKVDGSLKELATKEEMAKLDARLDKWGKVISGGVVAIAGSLIARVLGA